MIGCAAAFLVIVIALGGAICRWAHHHISIRKIMISLVHEIQIFDLNIFNFPLSENVLETQCLPTKS